MIDKYVNVELIAEKKLNISQNFVDSRSAQNYLYLKQN